MLPKAVAPGFPSISMERKVMQFVQDPVQFLLYLSRFEPTSPPLLWMYYWGKSFPAH